MPDANIARLANENEYKAALAELDRLWNVATPNNPEGTKFATLAQLVDDYEKRHHYVAPPDPVEATKFRHDQQQRKN